MWRAQGRHLRIIGSLARISAQGVGAIPVPAVTPLICGDDAGGVRSARWCVGASGLAKPDFDVPKFQDVGASRLSWTIAFTVSVLPGHAWGSRWWNTIPGRGPLNAQSTNDPMVVHRPAGTDSC